MLSGQNFPNPAFHSLLSCHRIINHTLSKKIFFRWGHGEIFSDSLLISERFCTHFFIVLQVCSFPILEIGKTTCWLKDWCVLQKTIWLRWTDHAFRWTKHVCSLLFGFYEQDGGRFTSTHEVNWIYEIRYVPSGFVISRYVYHLRNQCSYKNLKMQLYQNNWQQFSLHIQILLIICRREKEFYFLLLYAYGICRGPWCKVEC